MDDNKLEVRIMRIYNTRIADNVDLGTNMLVLFLILILDLELWGSTMVGQRGLIQIKPPPHHI